MWVLFVSSAFLASSAATDRFASGVSVEVASPHRPEEVEVLDAERLMAALRLRLHHVGVMVRGRRSAKATDWSVKLSFPRVGQLAVRVTSPAGEVWCDLAIATQGRGPRDLAHTVALLVVETLTPVIPPEGTVPKIVEQTETPAPSIATVEPWSWSLGLGATGTRFLPDPGVSWGLELVAQLNRGLLLRRAGRLACSKLQRCRLRGECAALSRSGRRRGTAAIGLGTTLRRVGPHRPPHRRQSQRRRGRFSRESLARRGAWFEALPQHTSVGGRNRCLSRSRPFSELESADRRWATDTRDGSHGLGARAAVGVPTSLTGLPKPRLPA